MKKFKAILSIAALSLAMTLSACSKSNDSANDDDDSTPVKEETSGKSASDPDVDLIGGKDSDSDNSAFSLGKSNEALIKEYQKLCNEMVEAVKNGDEAKLEKISKKGEALEAELEKRDLTAEEKQQMVKIAQEAASTMVSNASIDMDEIMGGDEY
ncbi:MAG: hypothetical protein K2K82_09480 [Muribaculaceae bacterium]|nr:hypothetical protein [Muribaculaceae bacterium]